MIRSLGVTGFRGCGG